MTLRGPVALSLSPELADLRGLFEAHRGQLERELGARLLVGGEGEEDAPSGWVVRLDADAPRLVIARARGELVTEAPDRAGLVEVLSLLHSLHRLPDGAHEVRDCASVEEAIDRIEQAVAETWPSFALHGIDWAACCARWRPRVASADDPVPELRAWLAELQDAHTWVVSDPPAGRLPYEAEVDGADVVLREVPVDTAGWDAGARPGQRLLGSNAREVLRTTAATAHSRRRVAGLRALQGPVGRRAELETDAGARWSEPWERVPWPRVVESSVLADGAGLVRLRAFLPDHEDELHAAIDAHRGRDLVLDLRGNGGGNLLMAHRLRDRFVREPTVMGSLRWTHPRGGLTEPEVLEARPTDEPWEDRVTFLVDALTYSAAEDAVLGLQGLPHVRVLGERSGGGSGRVRVLRLLPGWRLTITRCHSLDRDGRCIEGAGLPVDGPCPPELAGGEPAAPPSRRDDAP